MVGSSADWVLVRGQKGSLRFEAANPRLFPVTTGWEPEEVLAAVRALAVGRDTTPPGHEQFGYQLTRVDLDRPDTPLLVFRSPAKDGEELAARFSLRSIPRGPQSGLEYDTPDGWTGDLLGELDEAVATGATRWGDRLPGPHGLTLLRWWQGSSDTHD